MKRALLVGVDSYDNCNSLSGCVNDVRALLPLIARNEDDSPNFDCEVRTSDNHEITRRKLIQDIDLLLSPGAEVGLLYFAGHGTIDGDELTLVTSDGESGDWGIQTSRLLARVAQSSLREVILILDCCFSGEIGTVPQLGSTSAALRPGLSILAASRGDQVAAEEDSRGLFSTYLCGGLEGGAADVLGKVNIAGLDSYLSECFGAWGQRPMVKTNVDRLHEIRICAPAVPLAELRRLTEFFQTLESDFPLDPSYEPTAEPRDVVHEVDFAVLQRCRGAKLVEPVGTEHMYFAAMNGFSCRLTLLGRLYWMMAKQGRL